MAHRVALAGLVGLACAGAGSAIAAPSDDPTPPTGTFKMPGLTLRIEPTQVASGGREEIVFSAALTRKLTAGTLEVTLPKPWLERSPGNGATHARVPLKGSASTGRVRVRRTGRVVRFSFTKARRGDTGRYTVIDRTLGPGTYRAHFALRGGDYQSVTGLASVVVLGPPVRVPEP